MFHRPIIFALLAIPIRNSDFTTRYSGNLSKSNFECGALSAFRSERSEQEKRQTRIEILLRRLGVRAPSTIWNSFRVIHAEENCHWGYLTAFDTPTTVSSNQAAFVEFHFARCHSLHENSALSAGFDLSNLLRLCRFIAFYRNQIGVTFIRI